MNLASRIKDGTACVGVIGLGYVGLPLLRAFFLAGHPVVGFDVDPKKIDLLKKGENYLKHLGGAEFIGELSKSARFDATTDMSKMAGCDVLISCVPTPLGRHLEPDLTFVEQTADDIARTLRPGQLIVLESSTYPGTTREVMLPKFEARGFKCGQDFYLAYSPEREDPGRKDHSTQTIPKLVGGIDASSGELATALYRRAIKQVIPVSSAEVAEAAKILENTYRAINIALVNELKIVLDAMGVDVWEVVEAAKTKPFGFQAFYPGPGLGGHCIPIDPYYLTWKAREVGHATRFIELAGEVNRNMPKFVVQKVIHALNYRGRATKGSRVLVLGLAYKPDVDDVRESPSFEIIDELEQLGAEVDYSDPHVPHTHYMRKWGDLGKRSVALSAQSIGSYDCVLVATDHAAFDWKLIAERARLIIDTRNALRKHAADAAQRARADGRLLFA